MCRYTKHLPTSASATVAVANEVVSDRNTQQEGSAALPPGTGRNSADEPAGRNYDSRVVDSNDQWRNDLLAKLNSKLASRALMASMEGVDETDLRVLDEEIAAIRELSCGSR